MRASWLGTAGLVMGIALSARAQTTREVTVFAAASLRESFT